jgi:hypothetical protein
MIFWILVAVPAGLIMTRYALGAAARRRHRALRALEGPEAGWWDGRSDVWRYDRHHWGWGWRP